MIIGVCDDSIAGCHYVAITLFFIHFREKDRKAALILQMKDKTTVIRNPEASTLYFENFLLSHVIHVLNFRTLNVSNVC